MERLNDLLSLEQAEAVEVLRTTIGADPAQDSAFWEHLLAHMTAGVVTPQGASYDIDLLGTHVEVKYSSEFSMQLGNRRLSQVFRWAGLCGHGKTKKDATVLVLVGLDDDRHVWFWVIPYSSLGNTGTVTTVIPSRRVGSGRRSGLHAYRCVSGDVLALCLIADREHEVAMQAEAIAPLELAL